MPLFSRVFKDPHEETTVTQQISASEEAAVMELVRFMDGNPISAVTVPAILDVLVAADKFEFGSCVNHCTQLLKTFPTTLDSALSFLKLQSSVSMVEEVQPLVDAANQYLASYYENNVGFKDKLMALPLVGVESILSSDDLRVEQEDEILEFVLKWSRAKYPKLEEPREILTRHLLRHIRFPHLSLKRLKEVLSCDDLDRETAGELVMKALFVKLEPPRQQKGERPVKMVEFEVPRAQCVVYLDLKREECKRLFPFGAVFSETFMLAGEECFLSAYCIGSSDEHLFGVVFC